MTTTSPSMHSSQSVKSRQCRPTFSCSGLRPARRYSWFHVSGGGPKPLSWRPLGVTRRRSPTTSGHSRRSTTQTIIPASVTTIAQSVSSVARVPGVHAQLALAADVARYVAAPQVRYYFASRTTALKLGPLARECVRMTNYPTHEEIERATYIAWAIIGVLGLVVGAVLWPAFTFIARTTSMRVVAGLLIMLIGFGALVGMQWVHFKIAEEPFEPPVWIDPGATSKLLPLFAMIAGFSMVRAISRRVAAR